LKDLTETLTDEKFEAAYEEWMREQRRSSTRERLRRLTEISNYAEKLFLASVWWPSFGRFTNLHAEFQVTDFKDGFRFIDFAYIAEGFKVCIEIDGYGTHGKEANRRRFSDHLLRQNHLVIDGWIALRFPFDDLRENPLACQQILQQLFGRPERHDPGSTLPIG